MTKIQRAVIEEIIRKAERGPSLGFAGRSMTVEEADMQARIWSQTWISSPLRAVLDNVDGDLPAFMLKDWT